MSRKQSAVDRIRKKAATPGPPACNPNLDPFHNGQTPACRSLLHAVQDIFPELQQQMKDQTPSSDLGKLLRWHFLQRRKARALPPAPPLSVSSATQNRQEEVESSTTPTAALKKKRKRKKKKKDSTANPSGEVDNGGLGHGIPALVEGVIPREEAKPDTLDDNFDDFDETVMLKVDARDTDFDVRLLDRSVHELEEKLIKESSMAPSLLSLPSDGALHDFIKEEGHSSMAYFEQIQPEGMDDTDEFALPRKSPLKDGGGDVDKCLVPSPLRRTPTMPRSRASSVDSFASFTSFNDVSTPIILTSPTELDLLAVISPTHEWVPEDGSKAKVEAPPGDVIKNPLELPYLLTFTTDNGLTTISIDGSLISAGKSVNHHDKSSSLDTTKILLEEWTGQLLESGSESPNRRQEKDFNSFLEFLQSRLHETNNPLGIRMSDLKDSVIGIECYTCQQDALSVVNEWAERSSDKLLVLNPSVLHDDPDQDAKEVDAAFDYMALEEGHHKPKSEDEEYCKGIDLKTNLSFSLSQTETKRDDSKYLNITSLTSRHLGVLIEQWLPCGVEEEILVATSVNDSLSRGPQILDFDRITQIQRLILEKEKSISDALDELDQMGKDLHLELTEMPSSAQPNLEFKAFPKMKTVDQKCTAFSDKILLVLRSATLGQCPTLAEMQLRLWIAYLGALNKTLKACDAYYQRVAEEMADQRGVVPKMFVSAELRSLYQSLVQDKVRAWTELGSNLCRHLTKRTVKELCTRMVWHVQQSSEFDGGSENVDERCHSLIHELAGWTETILGGRIGDIQKERMGQTERMLEHLQTVIEPLAQEYASVEMYFSAERNLYFASLRSNVVFAHGVKKRMRLIDNAEVEGMTTGVILMWCHVRIMEGRMISSQGVPPLPLQLKRWMLHEENDFSEDWRGFGAAAMASPLNSYHQRYCQPGHGGKRRTMCILAGLVYSCLEEQCKIWMAEKAEKELLTDFDFGDDSPSDPTISGPASTSGKSTKSKKNKKKKNKNSLASSSVLGDPPKDSDPDSKPIQDDANKLAPTIDRISIYVSKQESKERPKLGNRNLEASRSSSDNKEAENSKVSNESIEDNAADIGPEDAPFTPADTLNPPEPTPISDSNSDESIESDKSIEETVAPQIYVKDGEKRIDAEDFLVFRMEDLLKTSKGEVVFI